jgi:hypothetical protein
MNKLLGIASLTLASAALAVALWGPRQDGAPAPSPQEAPTATSPADVEDLERRVRALEDTALGLSRRLMALEQRPVALADGGVVAGVPAALSAEVEQLRAEVRGLVAGEALHSEGGRTYLKDMVRSVQEEMRDEQRQTRQQEWQQAQAQAQAQRGERVRQFISDARLDYNQEQALTRRLQAEDAKREALLAEVSAGTKNPREVRQALRAERQQTDTEMRALLDEGQQAKYEEMRREERPRGGRGERAGDTQR